MTNKMNCLRAWQSQLLTLCYFSSKDVRVYGPSCTQMKTEYNCHYKMKVWFANPVPCIISMAHLMLENLTDGFVVREGDSLIIDYQITPMSPEKSFSIHRLPDSRLYVQIYNSTTYKIIRHFQAQSFGVAMRTLSQINTITRKPLNNERRLIVNDKEPLMLDEQRIKVFQFNKLTPRELDYLKNKLDTSKITL